jgi:hypothetical protein
VVTLNDFDFNVRNAASEALVNIAQALQQEGTHTEMIGKLRRAEVALQTIRTPGWETKARDVGRSAAFLEEVRKNERWQRLIRLGKEHPTVSAVTGLYTVLTLVSFLLLWLWPLAILHTNEALKPYMDIPIPIGIGDAKIPLRHLFLLGFFHYHPRVLDAWISKHIAFARTEFRRMSTVSDRDVHVPTPVFVDGKVILGLAANDLPTNDTFQALSATTGNHREARYSSQL